MLRRPKLLLSAFALLVALPALAAPPFGTFEGMGPGRNAGAGFIPLTGWALDDGGIARVEIWVDGQPAGTAFYGFRRPDVNAAYPLYPDSQTAGFSMELNTAKYLNGMHTVTAYAFSRIGEMVQLASYHYEFLNTTHNLVPFGQIEFPQPSTQMWGTCDLSDDRRRYWTVSGYAVDTGLEISDTGVKYVELLINGAFYANSVTDCFYSPALGGWVNCFGLPRPEIKNRYPTINNGFNSGFRFVLDVGALVNFGFAEGFHQLKVRAGDYAGQVADIAQIPVVFRCDDAIPNEGSFGAIELPVPYGIYAGRLRFYGWALDWEGIDRIRIYVDGQFLGNAILGRLRPEISSRYPGYPESLAPGWEFEVDASRFNDGLHSMQAIVVDDLGAETVIGETYFFFDSLYGAGGGGGQ